MKTTLILLSGLILTVCFSSLNAEPRRPRVIGLDAENIYVYDDAGNFTNDNVEEVLAEIFNSSSTLFYITYNTTTYRLDISTSVLITGELDIVHTATSADDHALEIDVDAAGFGDIKALDIDYITGAIEAGEDEAIILINIDEINATGGDVFGIEVLATDGSASVGGLKAGALVHPIHQDSGVFIDPTTGTDNTPSTDVPNMIDGSSTTLTSIFENDNEYILIGNAAAFEEIEFIIPTGSSGAGIKPTFEYSIAGSHLFTEWTPVDGTNGFRNTGIVAWDASDLTSHAINTDTNTFDIKVTRTRNSLSTTPILGYAKTAATTEYLWDKDGNVNIKSLTVEFGDLVSEQNPDLANAIRIKGTSSDVDVVLGHASGYFSVWNTADNANVFNVSDRGNTVIAGDLIVDTDTLFVDAGNNRVGIGVIDPDTQLEVFNAGTQLKLSYDGSDFITFATQADGDLTLDSNKASYNLDFGDGNLITTGGVTLASLTATVNLDIGAYSLQSLNFISDATTGTQPYACTSQTVNTNLNADMLDGLHVGTSGGAIPDLSQANTWAAKQTFDAGISLLDDDRIGLGDINQGNNDASIFFESATSLVTFQENGGAGNLLKGYKFEKSLSGTSRFIIEGDLEGAKVQWTAGNGSNSASANQTLKSAGNVGMGNANDGFVAISSGSIVGASILTHITIFAGSGTIDFEIKVNNTAVFVVTLTISGTGRITGRGRQLRDVDTFNESDLIKMEMNYISGDFTFTDSIGTVLAVYDN